MSFIENVRKLVAGNHIQEAIDCLLENVAPDSDFRDDVLSLSSQWEQNSHADLRGTTSMDITTITKNKISNGILTLVNKLEKEEEIVVESKDEIIIRLEIKIDTDFENYSREEQGKILKHISNILKMAPESIKVGFPRKGSTLLPIDLPEDKAKQLLEMIEKEDLAHLKVLSAKKIYERDGNEIRLYDHQPNLSLASLQEADLQGANLEGALLFEANLKGASLKGANLEEAYLFGAKLQFANLRLAKLQGADLRLAKLQGADLEEAKLQGADLEEANLQLANLQGANLQGANLRETYLWRANLQGASLQGANLQGANLEKAIFLEANLKGATAYRSQKLVLFNTRADISQVIFIPDDGIEERERLGST